MSRICGIRFRAEVEKSHFIILYTTSSCMVNLAALHRDGCQDKGLIVLTLPVTCPASCACLLGVTQRKWACVRLSVQASCDDHLANYCWAGLRRDSWTVLIGQVISIQMVSPWKDRGEGDAGLERREYFRTSCPFWCAKLCSEVLGSQYGYLNTWWDV